MVQLVRFEPDQLLELGGCGNMRSINIGGCGGILSARVECASVQRVDLDHSSCRTSNSCNKQVSESSNARLKPRLKGKQRSIDHHQHDNTVVSTKPNQPLTSFQFPKLRPFGKTKMVERICQSSWFNRWPFLQVKTHYFPIHVQVEEDENHWLVTATPTSGLLYS